MHSLSLYLIPGSAVAVQSQNVPATNECHGLCNNPSSEELDPLPLYAQQALLRKLASTLNRNRRRAKMQGRHRRLQHANNKRGKQQQVKIEWKKLPSDSENANKTKESVQKSRQFGNPVAFTPNFVVDNKCTIPSEALELKYRTRGQEISGTARSRHSPTWLSSEINQNHRSSPLSSTLQTSAPFILRTRNSPLLEFKSCHRSLIKECLEEVPPDAGLAVQDAVHSRNRATDDINAAQDDISLSSVCTSDKQSGQRLRVASQSYAFVTNWEENSKPVDGATLNESAVPQASLSLTSQPVESCNQADKNEASNFSYKLTNEIVLEQVAKAEGVDVGDSGSSTSRPLRLQPSNHIHDNEYSAAGSKVEFTESSIKAGHKKPLASTNDSDEVQQITLLDVLANAAIDASTEDSLLYQKFPGVADITRRHTDRKSSHCQDSVLEASPAEALRFPKGLFVHGKVGYTQKQATRHTVSILRRFQSFSSENFGVDANSIWPPLQGSDKQVDCMDQRDSTLHPTSEIIGLTNRSNLRRTAGLPVRLRDSVIELESKTQGRCRPNS